MVAIGGWGDIAGFEIAAKDEGSRRRFARNVRRMVEETGADGWFCFIENLLWEMSFLIWGVRRGC